ncbi:MAG: TetR/AcrR family transcriptional regulator [Candidatus Coproplasma sp.]
MEQERPFSDKKQDARIVRTKRDLRNAFIELIGEKQFEKLTVTEICRKASINKMTFYKHYQDKYALLDDCIKSVAENVFLKCVPNEDFDKRLSENPVDFLVDLLSSVMNECYDKKNVILSLSYGNNSSLRFVVSEYCNKLVCKLIVRMSNTYKLKYPAQVVSSFITGGFSNIIIDCLTMPTISIDQITKYARTFFTDLLSSKLVLF